MKAFILCAVACLGIAIQPGVGVAGADDLALEARAGSLHATVEEDFSVTSADGSRAGVVANGKRIAELSRTVSSVNGTATSTATALSELMPRLDRLGTVAINSTHLAAGLRADVDDLEEKCTEEVAALKVEVSTLKQFNQRYSLLLSTLLAGTGNAVPAASCRQVGSGRDGTYWLKGPDGTPFRAFCEQSEDGGGWTKVVHYKGDRFGNWTAGSTDAVGDVANMHVGAFAKLSDANINAAAGGGKKVYRFESTCTPRRFYVITNATWDDSVNGMGLDGNGNTDTLSCVADRMSRCVWKSGSLRRVFKGSGDDAGTGFDNQVAQGLDDSCDRWFTHHPAGEGHQCYKRSPTARCFSAGADCECSFQGAFPVHENVVISVREFDDDVVVNALESLVCP